MPVVLLTDGMIAPKCIRPIRSILRATLMDPTMEYLRSSLGTALKRSPDSICALLTQWISGHKYYFLSRFMFAFILIGLFFAVCSFFLGLLALCSRIGSFLSSALCSVALFFQILTASLMT